MATDISADTVPDTANGPPAPHQDSKVSHNFLIYLTSQVLSWAVTFVSLSIIPRTLGESNTGKLVVISSIAMMPFILAVPGADQYLVKEIGRDPSRAEALLGALMGLRMALIVPAVGGVIVVGFCLHAGPLDWMLIALVAPTTIFGLFTMAFRATFTGLERASRVGAVDLLMAWSPLLAIPFLRFGVVAPAATSMVASTIVVTAQILLLHRLVPLKPRWDPALWLEVLCKGIPFSINTYLLTAQAFVCVTVVRMTIGDAGVGVTGQVGRLFGTLMFVPAAITAAILPTLARMADTDVDRFQRSQSRVLALLIVVALPITALMAVIAPPLCHLLYTKTKFVAMPLALQTVSFALLPMYIVSTLYQFLVAQGRAMVWTRFLTMTVVVYAIVGYVAIPFCVRRFHNGPVGASIATIVAESISAILAMKLLRINPFNSDLVYRLLRGITAAGCMAGVMALVLKFLERMMPDGGFGAAAIQVAVPSVIGIATFAALARLLRILWPEDERKIAELAGQVTGRISAVIRR